MLEPDYLVGRTIPLCIRLVLYDGTVELDICTGTPTDADDCGGSGALDPTRKIPLASDEWFTASSSLQKFADL